MENHQELKLGAKLKDELDLDDKATLEDVQKSFQNQQNGIKQLMESAASAASKKNYQNQLNALNQLYEEFLKQNPQAAQSLKSAQPSPNQAENSPKTPEPTSYQSLSSSTPNADTQNAKTYTVGAPLSIEYMEEHFDQDPESMAKARSLSPAQAAKYDLLKSMKEPSIDVTFGLLDGEPTVLVSAKDIEIAKKCLDDNGYTNLTNAKKSLPAADNSEEPDAEQRSSFGPGNSK